jgi:hypothetical protein
MLNIKRFILLSLLFFIISCNDKVELNDLLKSNDFITKFELENIQDTIIKTEKGTLVYLNFSKTDYKGLVNVEISEAYNVYDQITYNLSTVSEDGILETKGMVKINVLDSNKNQLLDKVYFKIPNDYNEDYQLYELNKNGLWKKAITNCDDIRIDTAGYFITMAFYFRLEENITNFIMLGNDTINLNKYVTDSINICDLKLKEEPIGKLFFIQYKKDSITNDIFYDDVFLVKIEDSMAFSMEKTDINLDKYFENKKIFSISNNKNRHFNFHNHIYENYYHQYFNFNYSNEIINDYEKLYSKLGDSVAADRIFYMNKFKAIGVDTWANIDKLVEYDTKTLGKVNVLNAKPKDFLFAVFKKNNILVNISNFSEKIIPSNKEFKLIVIGLRDSKLSYAIKDNIILKEGEEKNITIDKLEETTEENLKEKINVKPY